MEKLIKYDFLIFFCHWPFQIVFLVPLLFFSLFFNCRYLLRFIFFLAAAKISVFIMGKALVKQGVIVDDS